MKSEWQAEWEQMLEAEEDFFTSCASAMENPLNTKIAERMPDNMQQVLDDGFRAAFTLIFEKGTPLLEKTYSRSRIAASYNEALRREDRLSAVRKAAEDLAKASTTLSAVEGVGLGLFGVGVPDIPIFTGVILRTVYEISLSFGFHYDAPEERSFILSVIETAMLRAEEQREADERLNRRILRMELARRERMQNTKEGKRKPTSEPASEVSARSGIGNGIDTQDRTRAVPDPEGSRESTAASSQEDGSQAVAKPAEEAAAIRNGSGEIPLALRRARALRTGENLQKEKKDAASSEGELALCIRAAAKVLSDELLYMKFLQSIGFVGVLGGASNPAVIRKISRYALLKYQRRFLLKRKREI